MQRPPPSSQQRGLPNIFSVAAPAVDPMHALPTTALRTLQAKAERARGALEVLIQNVAFDDGNPNVKYMVEWQSILNAYQHVLSQIQDISSYISDPRIRDLSGSSSTTPSNPFLQALVHLQNPINTDNDSIGRLEYMVVPARLPATRQSELEISEEQSELSGWIKDEQVKALMPQELAEFQDKMTVEILETKRRMRRAGQILDELASGLDWRMREADMEEMEGEEEEAGAGEDELEEVQLVQPPKRPQPAPGKPPEAHITGTASTPQSVDNTVSRSGSHDGMGGDSLFGDSMDLDSPAPKPAQTGQAPPAPRQSAPEIIDITEDAPDEDEDDDMEEIA